MFRNLKRVLLILVFLFFYVYILAIDSIPNEIVIFQGETLNLKTFLGLNLTTQGSEQEVMEVSANTRRKNNI